MRTRGFGISPDETLGKAYDSRLMKRLLQYVKPYMKYVVFAIALNVIAAGLGPLRPYLTKIAIDKYIANGDYDGLVGIVMILFSALVVQAVVRFFLTYFTQLMGQKIIYDIRTKLFTHIQNLSLKYFDKTPIGRMVTRVTNDVEALNQLFSSGIVTIFSDVFIIVWIFIFMFFMAWDLALVTLSVVPLLFYATFLFRKKVRNAYRNVRLHLARLNSYMQERLSGIFIVQLFTKEKAEEKKFGAINNDLRNANIKSILYYAMFFPVVEFLSSAAVALIIWYGGGQAVQGSITIGVLLAFIQYTEMFFRPIRDLSEKYNILQTAMASSERIFAVLDTEEVIADPVEPKLLGKVSGEIIFKNVWFSYIDNDYVLRDISFKIEKGETVAIVGATGAGKTSIINILNRFYEINKGEVLLDGIDIRELPKEELRKHISLVLQDVLLFAGTIKSNITLNNPGISDAEVVKAAKIVGIHDFIISLPGGYDSEVKEKGATLSAGQKQLISFARALVYNPQILILDEATSSVDTETEMLIQKATQNLLKDRTAIVIAHRLSTIKNADKILVMHKGKIRETGNHKELLAKKGIYFKLYQLQYKEHEFLNR